MNIEQIKKIQLSLQKIKSIRPFRYSVSVLPVDLSTNSCNVKLPFDDKLLSQNQFESFKEANVEFDYEVISHKKGIVERYEVSKYPDLVYSPKTGDKLKDMDFYVLSNTYIKGENILDKNNKLYNFLKNQKGVFIAINPFSFAIEFNADKSNTPSIEEIEEYNKNLETVQSELHNILKGMTDVIKDYDIKIDKGYTLIRTHDYKCKRCSKKFEYVDIHYPNYCYHCGNELSISIADTPINVLSCRIELI